jgi:hypothetical protein
LRISIKIKHKYKLKIHVVSSKNIVMLANKCHGGEAVEQLFLNIEHRYSETKIKKEICPRGPQKALSANGPQKALSANGAISVLKRKTE